jgi:hypothetical protein
MNVRLNGPTIFLDRRQTLEVVDALGTVASVGSGSLWITLENDTRDIVLDPGESWTIDRNGKTLLHAERPTSVKLTERLRPAGWRERITDLAASVRRAFAPSLSKRSPYH